MFWMTVAIEMNLAGFIKKETEKLSEGGENVYDVTIQKEELQNSSECWSMTGLFKEKEDSIES